MFTSWHDAILSGEATFFAGAGISAPAPASLPLAAGLVRSLIEPVLERLELPRALAERVAKALVALRPEVITDVLIEHLGVDAARPLLHVLRGRPNAWHTFLAAALARGCSVITTNFDTLIEQACDAADVHHAIAIGTGIEAGISTNSLLFKIHGSIDDALDSVALSVRQVGRGLTLEQTKLLRELVEKRPLIVLGYSGRDDFDIMPALLDLQRTAPGLWVVHEQGSAIRPLTGAAKRKAIAQPALTCAAAWPGFLDVVIGDTMEMADLLRPRARFGRFRDTTREHETPASVGPTRLEREASAVALLYALVEARAFPLAARLFASAPRSARVLIAWAVVLEKSGTDLRAAAGLAQKARAAAKRERPAVQALIYDQSGVIARRRGLHRLALRFYDRALEIASRSRSPGWLIAQIRSHRAVALEYLGRRAEALRDHRRVARYERRTGDLRGYAKSLNNIGIVHMNEGQWKPAIAAFERSCRLKKDLGDARGIAQSLHNLGKLHYLRGDYPAARDAFSESLRLRLGRGRDEHGAAQSWVALAHVARASGDADAARDHATRALEAHTKFGDGRGVAQARGLLKALAAT